MKMFENTPRKVGGYRLISSGRKNLSRVKRKKEKWDRKGKKEERTREN
jgi:hypothetical protein